MLAFGCVLDQGLDDFDRQLGLDGRGVGMAGGCGLVDPLVGALFGVAAREGYGGIAAADGGVCVACGAAEGIEEWSQVGAEVWPGDNQVWLGEAGEVGQDVIQAWNVSEYRRLYEDIGKDTHQRKHMPLACRCSTRYWSRLDRFQGMESRLG